ncbi:MAG: phosphonopyruvate decarboxylase, partial [Sphaerochaeta sp.]
TIDLVGLGLSLGYVQAHRARTREQLQEVLTEKGKGPVLIEVLIRPGNRHDLGRPTTTPIENKRAFMHYVAEAKK